MVQSVILDDDYDGDVESPNDDYHDDDDVCVKDDARKLHRNADSNDVSDFYNHYNKLNRDKVASDNDDHRDKNQHFDSLYDDYLLLVHLILNSPLIFEYSTLP